MSAAAAPESSSFMVDHHGVHDRVDRELLHEHLADGEFFWLDLYQPPAEDLALLTDIFRFHPLAVEDVDHFGQRPKIDPFGDFALIVAYGANEDQDGLVEVHCFFSERFLVTVHRDSCPPFDDLRRRAAMQMAPPARGAMLLYLVLDALTDSFFPGLSALDDRIDELEDSVLQTPGRRPAADALQAEASPGRVAQGHHSPAGHASRASPPGSSTIPGMTEDTERYFRDVYDHLIRISDLVDSYRDLLTGAMDVYLSTVSNRLNEVMKRLTIVATIFMPLTWIVGFFGMNFAWMVRDGGRLGALRAARRRDAARRRGGHARRCSAAAAGSEARPRRPPRRRLRHAPSSTHVLAWSTATNPRPAKNGSASGGEKRPNQRAPASMSCSMAAVTAAAAAPRPPVRLARADAVDARDVADPGAAGHGDRTAVVQGEEDRGVGAPGEADAEQPLAPVHGKLEGVGQDVPGREHAFDVAHACRPVPALGAHDVSGVDGHEREVAGVDEPQVAGRLGRLGRDRRGGVQHAGQVAPAQHGRRHGDPVAHAVGPVGDDPVEVVGRLAADADAHARRRPRLPVLRAADERAPAFALRADQFQE